LGKLDFFLAVLRPLQGALRRLVQASKKKTYFAQKFDGCHKTKKSILPKNDCLFCGKLISSCCFATALGLPLVAGAKQQEKNHFCKKMSEQVVKERSPYFLFDMDGFNTRPTKCSRLRCTLQIFLFL